MNEPAPISTKPDVRVHVALFSVQVAFATLSIVGKDALVYFEPTTIAFLRISGAALVLVFLHAARLGVPRLPIGDALKIFGFAMLGIVLNQLLFLMGLRHTTPIHATLLTCTIPAFTVVLAFVLGRERPHALGVGGVVLSFSGIAYLVSTDSLAAGPDAVVGDLLIVLNAFCYAVYLVLVRDVIEKHGTLTVVTLAFLFGTLVTAPLGIPALVSPAAPRPSAAWQLIAFLVLVPTLFTYLMNAWALRRSPSSLVAVYIYVQPIATAVFNKLLNRGAPSSNVYVAAALVFTGILLVTRRKTGTPLG